MKKLVYIILGCTLAVLSGCEKDPVLQEEQKEQFIKYYGSAFEDFGTKVKATADNGFIICGSTESAAGTSDGYLVKTDAFGNQEWSVSFGAANENDVANDVQIVSDGYVVVGSSEDSIYSNIMLAKISSIGIVLWDLQLKDPASPTISWQGNGIVTTSDGGLAIVGVTDAERRSLVGNTLLNPYGSEDMLWLKTNANGMIEKFVAYGGVKDDQGYDIVSYNVDRYAMVGTTLSFAEAGQENSANVLVVEANVEGRETDRITYGGANEEDGRAIALLADNSYIITGSSINGAGVSNMLVVKTASSDIHDLAEEFTFAGLGVSGGFDIALTTDGGFIACGSSGETSTTSDAFLVKLTVAGSALEAAGGWIQTFGNTGNEIGRSVIQTSDGGYAMAGSTSLQGTAMISLIKVNSAGKLNPNSK